MPVYEASFRDAAIIAPSTMGFDIQDMPYLGKNMEIVNVEHDSFNETWETVWGEKREVKNHYNEMLVALREKDEPNRLMNIRFRVYDDGLAFRYEFPEQEELVYFVIEDEKTSFLTPLFTHASSTL